MPPLTFYRDGTNADATGMSRRRKALLQCAITWYKLGHAEERMRRRELMIGAARVAGLATAGQLLPSVIRAASAQRGTGAAGGVPVTPPMELSARAAWHAGGGPNVNLRRTQASSAVVVDGRPYLIDCGYGTVPLPRRGRSRLSAAQHRVHHPPARRPHDRASRRC